MLLTHAWQEIRQHSGRFAATLLAIVVSVAFLAATQVYGDTEANAMRQRQALYASKADIVAESYLWHSRQARWRRDDGLETLEKALAADPRVEYLERFSRAFSQVTHRDRSVGVTLTSTPEWPLRWFTPTRGELPRGTNDIVLTEQTAKTLGVGVGDQVELSVTGLDAFTVVGLTDERGFADPPAYVAYSTMMAVDASFPPPDYTVLLHPDAATKRATPGSSGDGVGVSILIKLKDPEHTDINAMVTELQTELTRQAVLRIIVHVKPADQVRTEAAQATTTSTDWMGWMLRGTGALAMVVGGLIIATTFQILVSQRRRQTGLLRAVGASRAQVLLRYAAEALLLGVAGTAIGIPVGIAGAVVASRLGTDGARFGLQVNWRWLALIAVVGVVATVVASLVSIRSAVRVRPLEALQPALPAEGRRRSTVALAIICLVGLAAGVAGLLWGLDASRPLSPTRRIVAVTASAAVAAVAVMASSALWVPLLTRVVGRLVARARPTVRLAVANTGRSPARVGATATSLMLAVGLVVTVQVGASTGRAAAFGVVDQRYPVDIVMQSAVQPPELADPGNGQGPPGEVDEFGYLKGWDEKALALAQATPGVARARSFALTQPLPVQAGLTTWDEMPFTPLTPEAVAMYSHPVTLAPNQVGLSAEDIGRLNLRPGRTLQVFAFVASQDDADKGPMQLEVVEVNLAPMVAVVTPETFAKLTDPGTRQGLMLVELTDEGDAGTVMSQLNAKLVPDNPGLKMAGGAELKANVGALLDSVTLVLTGLLAVAALVALIGVSNTLGLSVMERTRESALLRALGLQRRGLRVMLLIEAALLSSISIVVGLGAGLVFGWVGAATIAHVLGWPTPGLAVNWTLTVLSCLAVAGAGVLASVLPGRRAALASPVDALADIG